MVRDEAGLTRKKITSGHRSTQPHFHVRNQFRIFLVNPASPRTISTDKKKISSGTQGIRDLDEINFNLPVTKKKLILRLI